MHNGLPSLDDAARYAALMSHRLTRAIIGDVVAVALVEAAARRFSVPFASIGLVGQSKVHFVAETGKRLHLVPRDLSFSTHAMASDDPLVVQDTIEDARFASHPTIVARGLRFLAMAPLIDRNSQRLGALCILDHEPHVMTASDIGELVRFATRAMQRIDLLSEVSDLARQALSVPPSEMPKDAIIW